MVGRAPPRAAHRVEEVLDFLELDFSGTPVVCIFGFSWVRAYVRLGTLKKRYINRLAQVHPDRGGLQFPDRAAGAVRILSRAFALVQHAAAYDAFIYGAQTQRLGPGSCAFPVPADLLFSAGETDTEKEMREAEKEMHDAHCHSDAPLVGSDGVACTGGADDDIDGDDAGDAND
mmetsp:Transcript_32421/g.114068  ORF Transcript_32421/g.114068 Transcript_32421/m.114068 type:complete len:174 (+) Transcript_32421:301-822(+)